jgi:hypothetical protein
VAWLLDGLVVKASGGRDHRPRSSTGVVSWIGQVLMGDG